MVNFETYRNLKHPDYVPDFCEVIIDQDDFFYYFDGLMWVEFNHEPEDLKKNLKKL
jgi:hypothetical protein